MKVRLMATPSSDQFTARTLGVVIILALINESAGGSGTSLGAALAIGAALLLN